MILNQFLPEVSGTNFLIFRKFTRTDIYINLTKYIPAKAAKNPTTKLAMV